MKLPASYSDASIRRKLMFIALLATAAATLFAILASTVQQWFLLRNELVKTVYAQASIVAANSTSALIFNDGAAAEQTLGALAAIDNIEFAVLLDKTGKHFARYVRPGLRTPPDERPAVEPGSNIQGAQHLDVVIPIVFSQEQIGSIHVRSNLAPVYAQLAWSLLVTVVAATGALLVAVLMLLRLLPSITDRLLSLVELMNIVSRDKNYTLRAELRGKDEVGTLAEGFNDMLAQIQARDNTLKQQREHLEDEVVQRTAELGETNRLLETELLERKRAEEQIRHYVAQLETAFRSTVGVATTLSEMRDPYTAGHERRVAEIAVAIGAELGFDARRQEGLRVAGCLHDVGKITIPAEILSKPGELSDIEYKLIKEHAQAGYDVLKDVEFVWPVAEVALQHHERMDGSGYPQGLKGEAILLEARIMAVADVVEALSSHRPYRPGLGIGKALAEIERGRGTAYDPAVADACLRLFRDKGYAIPA